MSTARWRDLQPKLVANALKKVSINHNRSLGIQLEISYARLDEIEQYGVSERRDRLIQCWLQEMDSPSWEKLIDALENIDQKRVAKEIKDEYYTTIQQEPPAQEVVGVIDDSPLSQDRVKLVESEIERLEEKFDEIVFNAQDDFNRKQSESSQFLSKFRVGLYLLPATAHKKQHQKFFDDTRKEIREAKTIDEIFETLSRFWNFMNYSLLRHIIKKFGSDFVKEKLKGYVTDLALFEENTKVREFLNASTSFLDVPPECSEVVTKMENEWAGYTLQYVRKYWRQLIQNAQLVDFSVFFIKGAWSSVNLVWAVPSAVLPLFITGLDESFLETYEVLSVYIDGEDLHVYRTRNIHWQTELQTTSQGQKDLFRACIDGDLDKVLELLTSGVEVDCRDEEDWTPLAIASIHRHIELVHVLLAYNADVNARNEDRDSVLHWACVGGDSNVVEVLLQEGAEVDSRNEANGTPLMYASSLGHVGVVKDLLNAGADVNLQVLDKSTALIKASDKGHSEVVELLLDAGADVNTQNQDGTTALMEACSRGYPDVVELLLERGADPSLRDEHGETALLKASYFCRSEIVQRLLCEGANIDVNTQTENGLNALMLTVKRIDPEAEKQLGITRDARLKTVEVLLDARAAVNVQEQSTGRTALFSAVTDGDLDLVRLLLLNGADPKIIDKEGVKALDVAEVHGHHEICKELKKYYQEQERPPRSEKKQSLMKRVQKGALRLLVVFNNVQERILNRKDKNNALKSAKRKKSKSQLPLSH